MNPATFVVPAWAMAPLFNRVEALYATAFALFQQERFPQAAAVFRAMLKAAPTDERTWIGLGECHERADHLLIALEMFGAGSIAAQPSARCALARARVLRKLDRTDDAFEALTEAQALAVSSDDGELLDVIKRETEGSHD